MSRQGHPLRTLAPELRLPAARVYARTKMPYFGVGIDAMHNRNMPGYGNMVVTDEGLLLTDAESLGDETPAEAGTGVLHEFLHVYFNHAARFKAAVARGLVTLDERALWNAAADLQANDNLRDAGCPMAWGEKQNKMLLPEQFGFPQHLIAEQYVPLLRASNWKPPAGPLRGCGWCGSGAGNPAPNEPSGGVPQDLQDAVRAVCETQVKAASQAAGGVPKGLSVDSARAHQVDWLGETRRAARREVELTLGDDDYTYDMPSRQQEALGCELGAPIMQAMRQLHAEVVFAADTSASMAEAERATIIAQLRQMLRSLARTRVRFIAADEDVCSDVQVSSATQAAAALKGGRGTDFRPMFERLARSRRKVDLCAFVTDGYGTYPASAPPFRVLWLVTHGGHVSVPWGRKIQLPDPGTVGGPAHARMRP